MIESQIKDRQGNWETRRKSKKKYWSKIVEMTEWSTNKWLKEKHQRNPEYYV